MALLIVAAFSMFLFSNVSSTNTPTLALLIVAAFSIFLFSNVSSTNTPTLQTTVIPLHRPPPIPLASFKNSVTNLPGFGRPLEKQYAGMLSIDKETDTNLFYWLFQNRNQSEIAKSPLIIWLQGGPGASSMYGSLAEKIGPYSVDESLNLTPNKHPWNQFAHVMFIDFPVGTGFSYTKSPDRYVRNDEQAASDMLEFIRRFHDRHPEFASSPVYLVGESYAGKWVPAIGARLLDERINVHGIVLVSPWVHPEAQIPAYTKHADAFGLLTKEQKFHADQMMEQCIELFKRGQMVESAKLWDDAAEYIYKCGGGFSPYDIRDTSGTADDPGAMDRWLALPEVRRALQANGHVWNEDGGVKVFEELREDDMVSSLPFLEQVVQRARILVVNGQYDWVCNFMGIENLLEEYLPWEGKYEFLDSRRAWRNRNTLGGYMRSGGNVTHLVMYDAGHMVPQDQPEHSFDIMRRFTQGEALA